MIYEEWLYGIVYKDSKKIGYTMTINEADDICLKNIQYQWKPINKRPLNLPLITIGTVSKQLCP